MLFNAGLLGDIGATGDLMGRMNEKHISRIRLEPESRAFLRCRLHALGRYFSTLNLKFLVVDRASP